MTWESSTNAILTVVSPTGEFEVRPNPTGLVSGLFPDPMGRTIYIFTVEGLVRGRFLAAMHDRAVEHWDAVGGEAGGTVKEQSLAVLGISRTEALALGRGFGRNAFIEWSTHTWTVIGCDGYSWTTRTWTSARDQTSRDLQGAFDLLGLPGAGCGKATATDAFHLALIGSDPSLQDDLRTALELVTRHIARCVEYAREGAEAASTAADQRALQAASEALRVEAAAVEAVAVAARKQIRQERRALATEARAAVHSADVRAGWPEAWQPLQVRAWTDAGCDLLDERRLEASGWYPAEILNLLDEPEFDPGWAPPEGAAADYRIHGDTLDSLLNQEWPTPPPHTVFSLKRTLQSGRRHRWTISELDGRLRLRQYSESRAGVWRSVRDEDAGTDLAGVIAATGSLRTVRRGAINQYTLGQDHLAGVDLLDLLRISTSGGDEDSLGWPLGAADDWSERDEALGEIADSIPMVSRWCTIDGERLVGLMVGRITYPLLVDESDGVSVEDALGAREIASFTWFSESGGAPISWDGGNSLSELGSLLWARQWGDEGAESTFSTLPSTSQTMAGVIAKWVCSVGAEVPAAFSLQRFDPNGTRSAAETELWGERFQGVEASLSLDVDAEVLEHLKTRLARKSPVYRRTRRAFLHPHGKDGQELGTALDAVLEHGVLGRLLSGDWDE